MENQSTRNAAERGAALRASATTPITDLHTSPVEHIDLPLDTMDFGDEGMVVDPLVAEEAEASEVDSHAAYILPHQFNAANEPGTLVTFVWPLKNGAGLENGRKVFMRRPRIMDQLRVQSARTKTGTRLEGAQQEVALFAMLCNILAEEVASLYDFDYESLQRAYVGFMQLPPRQS